MERERELRDVVVRERGQAGQEQRAARDKKAKSAHGLSLFVVAKWLVAERRPAPPAAPTTPLGPPPTPSTPIAASPAPFSRMPENFLRSLRRRSLRTKKTKTVIQEKRKSGKAPPSRRLGPRPWGHHRSEYQRNQRKFRETMSNHIWYGKLWKSERMPCRVKLQKS